MLKLANSSGRIQHVSGVWPLVTTLLLQRAFKWPIHKIWHLKGPDPFPGVILMPRSRRSFPGGYCYHVFNRSRGRETLFHTEEDYRAILRVVDESCRRIPLAIIAYCVMPNHFHFVVQPKDDDELSRWMHWFSTTHAARYHRHHESSGHLWEGRFKAFPIEEDEHLLTVLRYVERNPLRANLVDRAEEWWWSSLRWLDHVNRPTILDEGPVCRPTGWIELVNQPQTDAESQALRVCVEQSIPFGSAEWVADTCSEFSG